MSEIEQDNNNEESSDTLMQTASRVLKEYQKDIGFDVYHPMIKIADCLVILTSIVFSWWKKH